MTPKTESGRLHCRPTALEYPRAGVSNRPTPANTKNVLRKSHHALARAGFAENKFAVRRSLTVVKWRKKP
jgi:hypothetical protein